jgi:hypothetical protein
MPPKQVNASSSELTKKKYTGTDYDKFNKIDYKALGADDLTKADYDRYEEAKAYHDHQKKREDAIKRLAELDKEQHRNNLKLEQLEKQRVQTDRMVMGLGVAAMVVIMLVGAFSSGGIEQFLKDFLL